MEFVRSYLAKNNFCSCIEELPANGLNLCVVIPAYKEPDLITTLQSLWACTRPDSPVEVIVVINSPENATEDALSQNERSLLEGHIWVEHHFDEMLKFHLLHCPDLPKKFAGVGLARKIGMDEAVNRLLLAGNPKGIIACFDADATCDANYLRAVEKHFSQHPKSGGASIYFEHPISSSNDISGNGISQYELHLRYMNQALRYASHPYAFHTVGSSMAVRMKSYVKQGGMNKRQAGEDFYFLQKIIELGNFSELNTTRVIPSARISDRVPFGTGASMTRFHHDSELNTYSLNAYEDVRNFLSLVDTFYEAFHPDSIENLSSPLKEYLQNIHLADELKSIRSNSASLVTFRDRFYRWFNAFRVIKYLNFSHETWYHKKPILEEARHLQLTLGLQQQITDTTEMLLFYRKLERNGMMNDE